MSLEAEIQQLPSISQLGLALSAFVRAIHSPGEFVHEGRSWVYRPDNFVTFDIHYQRARNITLSLRRAPTEFEQIPSLPLTAGMGYVYSRCKIERADQLDAAAYYIRRALELYSRGRSRELKKEVRIEQRSEGMPVALTPAQAKQLERIMALCWQRPSASSDEYLEVIEEFHSLRSEVGTPQVLTAVFALGRTS